MQAQLGLVSFSSTIALHLHQDNAVGLTANVWAIYLRSIVQVPRIGGNQGTKGERSDAW